MAVTPGTINFIKDTLYRIGAMNPEGFYSQDQLNNNMSGNDANAIYYATHDQRYNPNDPREQARNERLVSQGYKPYYGQQEASPVWGQDAYVTGAGAAFEPYYDEAIPQGFGSPGGIPAEILQAGLDLSGGNRESNYANRIYADALAKVLNNLPR